MRDPKLMMILISGIALLLCVNAKWRGRKGFFFFLGGGRVGWGLMFGVLMFIRLRRRCEGEYRQQDSSRGCKAKVGAGGWRCQE